MVTGGLPAAMAAEEHGGVRGEDGREREEEGTEDGEQQQLTSELEPRTVAHGEVGRRDDGARRRRPERRGNGRRRRLRPSRDDSFGVGKEGSMARLVAVSEGARVAGIDYGHDGAERRSRWSGTI